MPDSAQTWLASEVPGALRWVFMYRFSGPSPGVSELVGLERAREAAHLFVLVVSQGHCAGWAGQEPLTQSTFTLPARPPEVRDETWVGLGVNAVVRSHQTTLVLQLSMINQINVCHYFKNKLSMAKTELPPVQCGRELKDSAD